jgi:Putative 2OG-Fe(II) oxygenase
LILIDPRGGVDWDKSNDGQLGSKTFAITPTTGKLVFFPSFMLHSVDSNMSNAVRISLSTDISILSQKSIEDFLESLQR